MYTGYIQSYHEEQNNTVLRIVFFFIIVGAVFAILHCVIKYRKRKRQRQQERVADSQPIVPQWLQKYQENKKNMKKFRIGKVKIVTHPYTPIHNKNGIEQLKTAAFFCQRIIDKMYGSRENFPLIMIPNDTCTMSVPMRNFKCGESCTDFEPICGKHPRSYSTYQMFCDNRIQVAKYVEDGVEYVAGYCIYLPSPYSKNYNRDVIENCMKGRKYKEQEDLDALERVSGEVMIVEEKEEDIGVRDQPQSSHDERNARIVMENLRSTFCSSIQQPVLIGKENGVTMHFEWIPNSRVFQKTSCSTCLFEEWEDQNPPSYDSIFS